jgi:hypothetical protein
VLDDADGTCVLACRRGTQAWLVKRNDGAGACGVLALLLQLIVFTRLQSIDDVMSSKQCSIAVRHGFFSIVVLFQTIFEKLLRQNLFIRSDPFNRANPLHVTYVAVMPYLLARLLSRGMCTGVIIESHQCSACLTTWSPVTSCELA